MDLIAVLNKQTNEKENADQNEQSQSRITNIEPKTTVKSYGCNEKNSEQ